MEFLRFGSSIPGSYWGCCAVDIIQNFKVNPDAPYAIELVNGDSGQPMMQGGGVAYIGKTYREVFEARLRINTFNTGEKPNHAFLAVLTSQQIYDKNSVGYKWMKILHENGFEFIRTTDNSVYTGASVSGKRGDSNAHENYIFGLFRNIGSHGLKDPFTPPKAWADLGCLWEAGNKDSMFDWQEAAWKAGKYPTFYTEAELSAAGVPVYSAGRRSDKPQEIKTLRDQKISPASTSGQTVSVGPAKAAPFAAA